MSLATTTESYPSAASAAVPVDTLNFDLRAARFLLLDHAAGSVRQINCVHVLQYLPGDQRVAVWNEWYRLLVPGGRAHVVVPYHSHAQAYAHPLTQWPPFSEHSFMFLDRAWRNASSSRRVDGLECDFEVASTDIDMDAVYATRSAQWKDDATRWFNNCGVQLTVWLTKRGN